MADTYQKKKKIQKQLNFKKHKEILVCTSKSLMFFIVAELNKVVLAFTY